MLDSEKVVGFVPISDADRSKAFYQKLGLKFVSQDSFAVVFDSNGNMLRLTLMKEVTPQRFTIMGWQVRNIESAVKELQAAGVQFEHYGEFMKQDALGIWTAPNGNKIAWFKDPDGNILSVSQHD